MLAEKNVHTCVPETNAFLLHNGRGGEQKEAICTARESALQLLQAQCLGKIHFLGHFKKDFPELISSLPNAEWNDRKVVDNA